MRLIDADALCLGKFVESRTEWHLGWNDALEAATTQAPTIEAEPVKHGKWKLHDDGSGTCNQCHHRQKNVWDDDNWQNYCGVCGAKMDLEG